MTLWAICPECSTQEVVSAADPVRPFATRAVFRAHGTAEIDLCPGSGHPPPVPSRPQGGWHVQILTRDDGILQAPLRLGRYNELRADADEQWLRLGRYRDKHWPSMLGASARSIEYLSPEDVAYIRELEAGQRQLAREMDEIRADLRREASR